MKCELNKEIMKLCRQSRELRIISKDPNISKEKSFEIQKKQDNTYKKYIFYKEILKKMR